jgi:hypothetical protein
VPVLLALPIEIVTGLRRGDLGLDIIAGLSITAQPWQPGRVGRRRDRRRP